MLQQLKGLTQLQLEHIYVLWSLIIINTFLVAFSTLTYIELVEAQGLVIKDYLSSAYGLVLVLPFIGRWNKKNPMGCLWWSITLELLAMLGFVYVSYTRNDGTVEVLIISTVLLLSGNFLARGLNTKVNSSVIHGCTDYSNLIVSTSALCTALMAGFGLLVIYYGANMSIILMLLIGSIMVSRYYKIRVFKIVYGIRGS